MNSWKFLEDAESCAEAAKAWSGTVMYRRLKRLEMVARFKAKAARYFEQNRPSRKGS